MGDVITPEHKELVMKFKRLYALYKENEVLIRIGAYQKGVDKELDEAVNKIEKMKKFLLQAPEEKFEFEQVVNLLKQTVN
jgi:flagellum-specific ATP synthase